MGISLNKTAGGCVMNKGELILLTTDEIKQPYEELSFIQVSAPAQGGHDELNEKLKKQAAVMGADAVIKIKYQMETASSIHPLFIAVAYNAIAAEGLAVRYKD